MSSYQQYEPYPSDTYNINSNYANYLAPLLVTGQALPSVLLPTFAYGGGLFYPFYNYNFLNSINNINNTANGVPPVNFNNAIPPEYPPAPQQNTQSRSRSNSTRSSRSSTSSTSSRYEVIRYIKRNKEEEYMKRVREWEESQEENGNDSYMETGDEYSQNATAGTIPDTTDQQSNRDRKRRKSKGKGQQRKQQPREGITNYQDLEEVPPKLKKYWHQRYELFSRYDEEIWMTENSWFEVTPESAAIAMANRVLSSFSEPTVVLDAFAGIGGNSIQFAMHPMCKHVYAIEIDPLAVQCAIHNAEVYGVADKITFTNMDTFKFFNSGKINGEEVKIDAIFMSPPWGGPQYSDHDVFDLERLKPYSFSKIYNEASKITRELCFFLPRTSDLNQLADYAMPGERITAVHYCIGYRSKGLCSYHGKLGTDQSYHVDDPDIALREDRHTL